MPVNRICIPLRLYRGNGDLTALKLCLERICPPKKSRPISIDLSDVKTSEGVSLAQTSVVQAVGEGDLILFPLHLPPQMPPQTKKDLTENR